MKPAITLFSLAALLVASQTSASAADTLPPATERFAGTPEADPPAEVPDFQRHLVPLLGKLGCNGRACHGSFQGQAGFRLSLFGYDFKMDHEGLSERVDTDDAAASYALEKATLATDHEGGKRMEAGSWEYNIFLNWIAAGAQPVKEDAPKLVKLHVTPTEIVFSSDAETSQLNAIAEWSDGTREDVTPLCRFQSNDTQVTTVTAEGLVSAGSPGDSHVVTFYDNAVVPIPVMRPVSDQTGENYPQIAAATQVDALVLEKLSKLGIVPSGQADDAQFLRRVSLDLAGTLPTADEVRKFLADTSPDKRSAKIDELLETPAYAAWWATRLCDFTGNSDQQLNNVRPNNVATREWYDWIHKRVADNVPYDELVSGLVLASSRQEGEDYREFSERQSSWFHKGEENQFADEPTMPHFWARRNFRAPEDRAVAFAYTFLGIRIQCAQCHKHPFDQWTQQDFEDFQGFFTRTQFAQNGTDRDAYREMIDELGVEEVRGGELRRELANLLKDGKTVPFGEVYTRPGRSNASANRRNRDRDNRAEQARLLGGESIDLATLEDPRQPLMEWLRSEDNPLFARAFVNRVWAAYFNRGIVEPTDDLSLANPPSNEALLDYLARGFVENGYDMKWVHRTIAGSDTYQRSWQPNDTNRQDERNFSRAVARRIPAEVAYDAIQMATLSDERTQSYLHDLSDRAIALPGVPRGNARYRGEFYALSIFGKSVRENNCDCERSAEPSLLQTIYLRNDEDLLSQIDRPKEGWLRDVTREAGVTFDARSAGPERPDNYDETIARYERQLKQFRDRKASPAAIKKAEQRLRDYRKQYGDATDKKSADDDSDESLAKDAALEIVQEAYLRTLSRVPTEQEQQVALAYFDEAEQPVDGLRDLLWSLLNTKEFIVNH